MLPDISNGRWPVAHADSSARLELHPLRGKACSARILRILLVSTLAGCLPCEFTSRPVSLLLIIPTCPPPDCTRPNVLMTAASPVSRDSVPKHPVYLAAGMTLVCIGSLAGPRGREMK